MNCITIFFSVLFFLVSNHFFGQSFYEKNMDSYAIHFCQDIIGIEKKLMKFDTLYFLASFSYPEVKYRFVMKMQGTCHLASLKRGKRLKKEDCEISCSDFTFSVDTSEYFYNYLNFNDSIQPNALRIISHGYTVVLGKYVLEQRELEIAVLNGSISSIRELESPYNHAQLYFRERYLEFRKCFDDLPSLDVKSRN